MNPLSQAPSMMPEPRLNQVLSAAAQGDALAWRELVNLYSKRVYGLVVRQCGDRELAEEITQATFVQVVRNLEKYSERGRFEPWLFRIAMNKLRDEMRRRKRQARTMDMTAANPETDSAWATTEAWVVLKSDLRDNDPLQSILRGEAVARLKQALTQLSPSDQEILYLRHTAGMGFAEIAASLKQPLGTVLARGHRALAKLRKLLGDEIKN